MRRHWPTALLALPALALLVAGWIRRWMSDDAFINFRVVDHLLHGNGPVFNEGERVEVYTSALWLALLAVVDGLLWFAEIEWISVVLGLLLAAGGLLAATFAAAQLARQLGATGPPVPLGALVIAALPPFWDFATSGLETGLSLGWIGLSFWLLVRVHGGRPLHLLTAVVIGLGPLVRPDLAVFSLGFLAALVVLRLPASRLDVAKLIGAAAAIPVAYEVFRMGYFAAVVPNTAFAKEAGRAWWEQGSAYVRDFVEPYYLVLPVALLLVAWNVELVRALEQRRWRAAVLLAAPVVCGAAHALYVVRVGGDFMHGRLFLPSLFGTLLPVAAVAPRNWRLYALPAGVVVVWAVVAAATFRVPESVEEAAPGQIVSTSPIVDERWWYTHAGDGEAAIELEDYAAPPYSSGWALDGGRLRRFAEEGREAVAIEGVWIPGWRPSDAAHADVVGSHQNVGMFAYAAGRDVRIVDRHGLADPIAGRLELAVRGRPGHEKELPHAWVLARFVEPESLPDAPPGTPSVPPEQLPAAREALACGKLADVLEAVEEPLTPGRFIRNIGVSLSTARFRLPPDPVAARDELCG